MDYSLLVGIHYQDRETKDQEEKKALGESGIYGLTDKQEIGLNTKASNPKGMRKFGMIRRSSWLQVLTARDSVHVSATVFCYGK